MRFQKAGLAGRFQTVPDGYTDRCNTATTATLWTKKLFDILKTKKMKALKMIEN